MYFQKSGNKYHAKSTSYGGNVYHSKLEAAYAQELDLRVKAGDIKDWERQVKLDLRVEDKHVANYYIDFVVHHNDGSREFVEIKGMVLPLFQIKWRIFENTFDKYFRKHPDDCITLVKQSSWGMYKKRKN